MKRLRLLFLGIICSWSLFAVATAAVAAPAQPPTKTPADGPDGDVARIYVIPIREQISAPVLYVLRRGLKEAIRENATAVVLDMKTPGGRVDVTLDIMEALDQFPGETITYVNDEAMSAGALISGVTDNIWYAPKAVIGAAEIVNSDGKDVDESMKRKVESYLGAKIRAYSESNPLREKVLEAMMNPKVEFKLGDTVIKPADKLLSLTATEAMRPYGDPPRPLFATGIATTIDDLLTQKYGADNYRLTRLELTWSEQLAHCITTIAPILMGLGLLGIFIEMKTPGFGFFGIAGGILLAIVFFGHYIAGLSGNEAWIVFALGVILVVVELLFFPGTVLVALTGILLMLGALVWSMTDFWPNEPLSISSGMFTRPLLNLLGGMVVAVAGGIALMRFLPHGWFLDRLVLSAAVEGTSGSTIDDIEAAPGSETPVVGQTGVTVSALRPAGQIRLGDRHFEARVAVGTIDKGRPVRVIGRQGFELLVEEECDNND
jgi:membrane-bound serine protease (ClpP class)